MPHWFFVAKFPPKLTATMYNIEGNLTKAKIRNVILNETEPSKLRPLNVNVSSHPLSLHDELNIVII